MAVKNDEFDNGEILFETLSGKHCLYHTLVPGEKMRKIKELLIALREIILYKTKKLKFI